MKTKIYLLLISGLFCIPLIAQTQYTGVNLAGADFGESNLPGEYGVHYSYPTHDEVDYFMDKGMNVFRLPFRWERLQQSQYADFDAEEMAYMDDFITYATNAQASVVLDPHNYARYYGDIIGSTALPVAVFEDFWSRLATHYMDNPLVIFGLMNEPHTMSSELWRDDANAAIAAIRATGATNLILVPGNAWTGAHSWSQGWYGTPNATTMLTIVDSLDNMAFDVHQYLDEDSSGRNPDCVSTTIGAARLQDFTNWARTNGKRGWLGEFGVSSDITCLVALNNMLNFVDANTDVWLGWTWWAAGPRWGDYMFSIEPANGVDKPQMPFLEPHIGPVNTSGPELVLEYRLNQNYPNPFNAGTHIIFNLVKTQFVSLKIYDIRGHKIASLVNGTLTPAEYNIRFAANNYPSGIYFYHLDAGEFQSVNKMVLAR